MEEHWRNNSKKLDGGRLGVGTELLSYVMLFVAKFVDLVRLYLSARSLVVRVSS